MTGLFCYPGIFKCGAAGADNALADVVDLFKDDGVLNEMVIKPVKDALAGIFTGAGTNTTEEGLLAMSVPSECLTLANNEGSAKACGDMMGPGIVDTFHKNTKQKQLEDKVTEISGQYKMLLKQYNDQEYIKLGLTPPASFEEGIGWGGQIKIGAECGASWGVSAGFSAGVVMDLSIGSDQDDNTDFGMSLP